MDTTRDFFQGPSFRATNSTYQQQKILKIAFSIFEIIIGVNEIQHFQFKIKDFIDQQKCFHT